jgi:hypothetical protein
MENRDETGRKDEHHHRHGLSHDDPHELFEHPIDATVIPDRIPEANSPEPHEDVWDSDRTDVLGQIDEVGRTPRREILQNRPEGGDIPRANEDRIDDLG